MELLSGGICGNTILSKVGNIFPSVIRVVVQTERPPESLVTP